MWLSAERTGWTAPVSTSASRMGWCPHGAGWETIEVDGKEVIRARPAEARGRKRTMERFCFYCLAKTTGKKIGNKASWTGTTPIWCPLGRGEEDCREQTD